MISYDVDIIEDIEYLYISTRLRAHENNFLGREGLMRLASARGYDDVIKLLSEHGWAKFDPNNSSELEQQITSKRQEMFDILERYAPDIKIIDVFRLKYDYHNIKVLIKSAALNIDAEYLLSGAGTIAPEKMLKAFREKDFSLLDSHMKIALQEAADMLSRTGDPQLSDLLLDREMAARMLLLSENTLSEFLTGYVKLLIDSGNLRVFTRAALCKKSHDYLRRAIFPGGSFGSMLLSGDISPDMIKSRVGNGPLAEAADAAAMAVEAGGSLAALDLACDNALLNYLRPSRIAPFGETQLIAYMQAFESELISVRTILSGRIAQMSEDRIVERLRMSYV